MTLQKLFQFHSRDVKLYSSHLTAAHWYCSLPAIVRAKVDDTGFGDLSKCFPIPPAARSFFEAWVSDGGISPIPFISRLGR